MRISDWSSDVCSSDLKGGGGNPFVIVECIIGIIVETIGYGVLVMSDLAKGDDLIALLLQVGGQLADCGVGAVVVRLRPVERGHHDREQRLAARGDRRRSDGRPLERQPYGREARNTEDRRVRKK